jgi:lipopolysaccharide cholinephosphotransferase
MGISKVDSSKALELSKKKCLEVLNVFVDLCEKHEITYWLDGGTLLGAIRHGGMIPWDDDIDVCLPEKDYIKALDIIVKFSKEDNPYTAFFHGSGFRFCYDYFGDTSVLVDGIFPARIDLICVKYIPNNQSAIAIDNSWANIASLYFKGYAKHPEQILEEHFHFLPKGKNLIAENERFFSAYQQYMHNSMTLPDSENDLLLYYATNDIFVQRNRQAFNYAWIFPLSTIEFENRMFLAPHNVDMYLKHLYGENYMQLPPEGQRKNHMNFISTSTVDKSIQQLFLIDFYKSGFFNLAHTKKNEMIARKFMKVKTFTKLIIKYSLKGQFSLLKGLIWYSKNKITNN